MTSIESQLVKSHDKFLGYIRKRISDPELSEDILQDCLLKAIRSAPEIEEEERLVRWFYRILQNAITDAYRRRAADLNRRMNYAREADLAGGAEDEKDLCECVGELVKTLKPEYTEVIEAVDLHEEKPEIVSKRLHISRNNLKVRVYRARQALRKRLEETCRVCARHHCLDCECK